VGAASPDLSARKRYWSQTPVRRTIKGMSTFSGDGPSLRIGHQERESAYQALDAHLTAGRLDVDEYGERYGKASVARTRADLDELFVDLPLPHAAEPAPPGEPARPVERAQPWRSSLQLAAALATVLPLALLVLVVLTGSWLWFLLIPAFGSLVGGPRRRRMYGGRRRHWY